MRLHQMQTVRMAARRKSVPSQNPRLLRFAPMPSTRVRRTPAAESPTETRAAVEALFL